MSAHAAQLTRARRKPPKLTVGPNPITLALARALTLARALNPTPTKARREMVAEVEVKQLR